VRRRACGPPVVPRLSGPPEWLAAETRQRPTAATMLVADKRCGSLP